MDKQVTNTPNTWKWGGGGGSGYLYLHYWPPVDWEPAIIVDMVNNQHHSACSSFPHVPANC